MSNWIYMLLKPARHPSVQNQASRRFGLAGRNHLKIQTRPVLMRTTPLHDYVSNAPDRRPALRFRRGRAEAGWRGTELCPVSLPFWRSEDHVYPRTRAGREASRQFKKYATLQTFRE